MEFRHGVLVRLVDGTRRAPVVLHFSISGARTPRLN